MNNASRACLLADMDSGPESGSRLPTAGDDPRHATEEAQGRGRRWTQAAPGTDLCETGFYQIQPAEEALDLLSGPEHGRGAGLGVAVLDRGLDIRRGAVRGDVGDRQHAAAGHPPSERRYLFPGLLVVAQEVQHRHE